MWPWVQTPVPSLISLSVCSPAPFIPSQRREELTVASISAHLSYRETSRRRLYYKLCMPSSFFCVISVAQWSLQMHLIKSLSLVSPDFQITLHSADNLASFFYKGSRNVQIKSLMHLSPSRKNTFHAPHPHSSALGRPLDNRFRWLRL